MPTMAEILSEAEGRLYQLAYLWSGDRGRAHALVLYCLTHLAGEPSELARVLEASAPAEALVHVLARQLDQREQGRMSLRVLDDVLRTDLTDPTVVPPEQAREHEVLLWELKRTCLSAVLGAIPAPRRLAFILEVFGYSVAEIATILGVSESSVRVRNTRVRSALRDYLGSRCRHVNPNNPCYCRGRLQTAKRAGFVRLPPHRADTPEVPCDQGPVYDEPTDLYRHLPPIVPSAEQHAELAYIAGVADGLRAANAS